MPTGGSSAVDAEAARLEFGGIARGAGSGVDRGPHPQARRRGVKLFDAHPRDRTGLHTPHGPSVRKIT